MEEEQHVCYSQTSALGRRVPGVHPSLNSGIWGGNAFLTFLLADYGETHTEPSVDIKQSYREKKLHQRRLSFQHFKNRYLEPQGQQCICLSLIKLQDNMNGFWASCTPTSENRALKTSINHNTDNTLQRQNSNKGHYSSKNINTSRWPFANYFLIQYFKLISQVGCKQTCVQVVWAFTQEICERKMA